MVVILAVVAIVAGAAARFWGLETKVFFVDEAFSALRISGHTYAQVTALFDGRLHDAMQIAALQEVPQGIGATVSSILREEPQRGLVYYFGAALWSGVFGTTIAAERAFSALLGVIGIGLGFVLGRRASGSPLGGILFAALIALSPFHIRYSQQVREYVLFADCILLAGWLLLRVLERPDAGRWAVFAIASAVGLYVEPLFVFVLLAAALVVGMERPLDRAKAGGFALSAGAALACFIPLAILNVQSNARTALGVSWAATPYALQAYVIKWLFNLGATFFDAELVRKTWALALIPLVLLMVYATVFALRRGLAGDRGARLAIALLTCTSLPFIAADFVKHAHYEAVTRYQVATWIGLELAVALALYAALTSSEAPGRLIAGIVFVFVLVCGALSAIVSQPYEIWWDNNQTVATESVARAIPSYPLPTIIVQRDAAVDLLALGRYLDRDDNLFLIGDRAVRMRAMSPPYFVFLPNAQLRAFFAANGTLVNVSPPARSIVPALAASQGLSDPKTALWRWYP